MAHFAYEATTSEGKIMRGMLEAESRETAEKTLSEMGLSLQELTQQRPQPKTPLGRNEFLLFNQQLTAITNAGIPMEQALRELSRDVASKAVKGLLTTMANELDQGKSLDHVIEAYEHRFPPMYAQLIKAGIQTGRLNGLLASLNKHLHLVHQTKRILAEAAAYPLLVLLMVLGLATVTMELALPALQRVYRTLSGEIPSMVQLILNASKMSGSFWMSVAGLIIASIGVYFFLSSRPSGRKRLESMLLYTPILGSVYRASILSRFADAMGLLVGSGQPLPNALRLSGKSTGSECLQEECEQWAKEVEAGKSLEQASKICNFVPSYFVYALQIGAKRGELQDSLYLLSQMYTDQVQANQGRLQAALMPVLLLVVGVFVGLLALALLAPYFGMFANVRLH